MQEKDRGYIWCCLLMAPTPLVFVHGKNEFNNHLCMGEGLREIMLFDSGKQYFIVC